jgi:hypothetical protein
MGKTTKSMRPDDEREPVIELNKPKKVLRREKIQENLNQGRGLYASEHLDRDDALFLSANIRM